MTEQGDPRPAGYAPYLDTRPPTPQEATLVSGLLEPMAWLSGDLDTRATDYGTDTLALEHLAEVKARTVARVEKVKAAVNARLAREIAYWDHRAAELDLQARAGKSPRMNPERALGRAEELQRRLHTRMAELDREAQLASQPPVVVGGALILPAGLLAKAAGAVQPRNVHQTLDTTTVERRAVDAVLAMEAALGRDAVEMPHNHPGYDVRSTTADQEVTFIEVKGRIEGSPTFTVTQNELRFAANIPDFYTLALVEVSPDGPSGDHVRYLTRPYGSEVRLPFDTTSTTLSWAAYWQRGRTPKEP